MTQNSGPTTALERQAICWHTNREVVGSRGPYTVNVFGADGLLDHRRRVVVYRMRCLDCSYRWNIEVGQP